MAVEHAKLWALTQRKTVGTNPAQNKYCAEL